MNKVTEFLEQNVEWLCLGLGGLFLLWAVWAYVIQPPVTVQLGGQELSLSAVDREILRGPAAELQRRMNQPGTPDLRVSDIAGQFRTLLANANTPAPPNLLATATPFPGTEGPGGAPAPPPTTPQYITELAVLPAPQPVLETRPGATQASHAVVKGTSQVSLPAGAVQPEAQPAVNPVRAGATIADRNWITLAYSIDMAALANELQAKKYYQVLNDQPITAFLSVEVERQELVGPNRWSDPIPVPRLPMNLLPPMPPAQNPPQDAAQQYLRWAEQNTLFILKPPFYPTVAGVMWHEPGLPPALTTDTGDAAATDREAAIRAYRQQQIEEAERRRQERLNRPRPSRSTDEDGDRPTRRGRRSREDNAPRHERPASGLRGGVEFYQARDPYRRPAPPPMFDDSDIPMDPTMEEMAPARSGQPQPGVIPAEVKGRFVPTAQTPPVDFWVHDDQVEPGKTYRYRVRYHLLNPVYGLFNATQPAELQEVFSLASPWSDWSEPIDMDSLSQFFVVGGGRDNVTFDVFKWENGGWQQVTFSNVRAGDMVGGKRTTYGKEVDFSTGATLVDIRQGPSRETLVLLMDSQGNLITRDFRTDQNDPARKELEKKAAQDRIRFQQARPGESPAAGMR